MNKNRGRPGGAETRRQIVEAALATLKEDGFAGASSRAIARRGGFNQALIFYHFGNLDSLLLAALDRTSEERLARYRAAVEDARTSDELVRVAVRIYAEDRDGGHITVVSQMIAGAVSRPELAPAVLERMKPWIDLCEQAVVRLGLPDLVPSREVAQAIVTFYLGVNLLTHLEADHSPLDSLFARVESLAPLLPNRGYVREAAP